MPAGWSQNEPFRASGSELATIDVPIRAFNLCSSGKVGCVYRKADLIVLVLDLILIGIIGGVVRRRLTGFVPRIRRSANNCSWARAGKMRNAEEMQ